MADTLICGTCRYVTADYENFKNHRIVGCQRKKEQDEPAYFKCASCDNRFKSAWAILCHLTEFHRMMLYKVEEGQEQQKDNQNNNEDPRNVSYASYASSQPAYATAATLPVYTQAPPPPRPAYPPAGYSQIPGLGSPFTMPPAPEPPQDSVISAAPVRYSNGSSSSSR
ncbi:zinc finger, C2H2 type [Ancylostoma ceylanicum]|uniref:Zinc finger, C2H2 type n=1 Tax=Ancylostoma ceylanicum TaxID=53326 RepID=A0A0D6LRC3_9BILA|nr:zinc finger, C2H2 type [Ancylostoma ceylanicum]